MGKNRYFVTNWEGRCMMASPDHMKASTFAAQARAKGRLDWTVQLTHTTGEEFKAKEARLSSLS